MPSPMPNPLAPPEPALVRLGRTRLETMAAAGAEVRECLRVLARSDDTVVSELARGHATPVPYQHYPSGDVYDAEHRAQFYYHCHSADDPGHLHAFLRPAAAGPDDAEGPVHLVAIGLGRGGQPVRLFTTNAWVTGESWRPAAAVCRLLPRFRVDHARPSWPANRWITAMLVLFRPLIEDLLDARDRAVAAAGGSVALQDQTLEVTSSADITIDGQIAAIWQALRALDKETPPP